MTTSGEPGLVLDASVWINLLATGAVDVILQAIRARVIVVSSASDELIRHPLDRTQKGHPLESLVERALVERHELGDSAGERFVELVSAAPPDDLGDGEAATIAFAHVHGLIAVIDERKARRVAASRFPELGTLTTVALLRRAEVVAALGDGISEAVFSALQVARMRVLAADVEWIVKCVGEERAAQCPSLRRKQRTPK